MNIRDLESWHMNHLTRIVKSQRFSEDLNEIESYIVNNYEKLHYHWGLKTN